MLKGRKMLHQFISQRDSEEAMMRSIGKAGNVKANGKGGKEATRTDRRFSHTVRKEEEIGIPVPHFHFASLSLSLCQHLPGFL